MIKYLMSFIKNKKINNYVNKSLKNKKMFMGIFNNKEYYSCLNSMAHVLISGSSSSTKTETAKSLVYLINKTYISKKEPIDWFFIDGKKSVEWNEIANVLSKQPVAFINEGKEFPIKYPENILKTIYEEYQKRKDLFNKTETTDINDYNKNNTNKMSRIVCVIDELRMLNSTKEYKQSINPLLFRLLSEARSFGIHFIIITSSIKETSIPYNLKENIPTQIIHRNVNEEDLLNLSFDELKDEYFYFNCPVSNEKMIELKLPKISIENFKEFE